MPKPPYTVKVSGLGLEFDRAIDEATANRIMNLIMTGSTTLPNANPGAGSVAMTATAGGDLGTPKQFLALKRPATDYERVACLAYYLTHARKIPKFKTKDMTALNTDAAQHTFSNASGAVADATTKYRYLSSAGSSGAKQITNLGEIVVDALPDRDKVKAALAENRPKKKKKRIAAKKRKPAKAA
jgi:hypothetical protein